MKKNNFILFVFALSLASFKSFCNEHNDTLITAYISNNILYLEQYTDTELAACAGRLDDEFRKTHLLAAINLEHKDCIVEMPTIGEIPLNEITITAREDKTQTTYIINRNALLEATTYAMAAVDSVIFSPWHHHDICTEEPPLLETEISGSMFKLTYCKNNRCERIVAFDCPVASICGIIVPKSENNVTLGYAEMISIDEAISKDLLVPLFVINECDINKTNGDFETDDAMDDILNAMEKDGTFEVKPVGPFMAFLRNVGGHMLIGYLACKEYFECIASRLFHREQTPCPTNNQSTM